MATKPSGKKGYTLEELLRAYFLRAGFFVVRGAPFQTDGENHTDIDLWLYERSTGTARRRQIVDAKSKTKPKAVERLLWTKGLAEALDLDGAYIATKDTRQSLRKMANKLGVFLLDGGDIQRIEKSQKVVMPDRMTDEELNELIKSVDKSRHNKDLQFQLNDLKGAIVDNFGVSSVVRALEVLSYFAQETVTAHPDSDAARVSGRLTYFGAAIAAVSLDFVSVEAPFRTADERREMFVNAVRYGTTDKEVGLEKLRLAIGLIRQYAADGGGIARKVEEGFTKELNAIPAEIVADQAIRMAKNGALFTVAKELEHASYVKDCPPFDRLETSAKALLGAFFDYCSIDRSKFASAWKSSVAEDSDPKTSIANASNEVNENAGPLFKR